MPAAAGPPHPCPPSLQLPPPAEAALSAAGTDPSSSHPAATASGSGCPEMLRDLRMIRPGPLMRRTAASNRAGSSTAAAAAAAGAPGALGAGPARGHSVAAGRPQAGAAPAAPAPPAAATLSPCVAAAGATAVAAAAAAPAAAVCAGSYRRWTRRMRSRIALKFGRSPGSNAVQSEMSCCSAASARRSVSPAL
jgi:hypothetical protein